MKSFSQYAWTLLLALFGLPMLSAQCVTWADLSNKGDIEDAYSIYTQFVNGNTTMEDMDKLQGEYYTTAVENWEKVYNNAPAADGHRDGVYTDGITIYLHKLSKEEDATKKQEYVDKVMELYDNAVECLKSGTITLQGIKSEDRIGQLRGEQGYNMFYKLQTPYSKTMEVLENAIAQQGNSTLYNVLEPLAHVAVYQYQNELIDAEKAREIHTTLMDISDYNIENNDTYGEYYESTKARIKNAYNAIEADIFDCQYFKDKLLPNFKEHPDDLEVIKYVYVTLIGHGCDENDPEIKDVKTKYEQLAASINAELQKERRMNNPGYDAVQLQKEGNYQQAVKRYREALDTETDPNARSQYYYSIASIQTWELGQYTQARVNALNAAKEKPGWGKPFILIGDMYSKTARSCGDDWQSRLAIMAAIEKYEYARSIDAEVGSDARSRISKLSGSLPPVSEGHMRKVKSGAKAKVKCWIGETVRVRFQ